MIESCLDRHFILHLLWSDNIFQIRTYFAVSFKTSQNKEQFFFVAPFFELFHEDRKNLYLCAPGWSERGRSLPFITPSALLSPSKEGRDEEWDTCPFFIPFVITPADPKLTNKDFIYIDTQGSLFNKVSRLWGTGGDNPSRKNSRSKSFMLSHCLNWSCQKTSPSPLQGKRDQLRCNSSDRN